MGNANANNVSNLNPDTAKNKKFAKLELRFDESELAELAELAELTELNDKNENIEFNQILRDGLARIGKLRIGNKEWLTPAVIEFDTIKEVVGNTFVPLNLYLLDKERFKILRREDENFRVFNVLFSNVYDFISLIKDIFKISHLPTYAPAIATPSRIPLLSYFGIDVFDTISAEVMAEKGIFMHFYGEFKASTLKENPCSCEVCSKYGKEVLEDTELLKMHNISIMKWQANITREMIKRGEIRSFVESCITHSPEMVTALRLADREKIYGSFQRFKKAKAKFCTEQSFTRPEVTYFLERVAEIYHPATNIAVVLPCSARKPYSLSKTHKAIRRYIPYMLNEIIVSSPLVTPREFELCYPAINYDVPVTGYWSKEEIEFVARRLSNLLVKFEKAIGYLSGGYREVFERACSIAGVDCLVVDDLKALKNAVEKANLNLDSSKNKNKKIDLYKEIFKHMMLYQFDLKPEFDVVVRGKYPEISFFRHNRKERERFARVDVLRGMLDLYSPEYLIKREAYVVEIDDFIPKGTIFAAGILKADERIMPGDLVAFKNDLCVGIGISRMSGKEMVGFEKGYAIDVKRTNVLM